MPLDPYLASRLHLIEGLDRSAYVDPDGQQRLAAFAEDPELWSLPADVSRDDDSAPGPDGLVPVRVYRPRSVKSAGLVVWVHGGGFWAGDIDMNEAHMVSSELAHRAGCVVVSVDYRLAANGVKFPVPVDDVIAAWRWAVETFEHDGPAYLGGASAGAALALAAAISERDAHREVPGGLLLAYPFAHYPNPAVGDVTQQQLRELPSILRFSPGDVDDMVANYVGRLWAVPDLALPGAADLRGLPSTLILVSELDDLRGSGELLSRQLADAGVDATLEVCAGMLHGHLNRTPTLPEVDRTLDRMADTILSRPVD